MTPQHSTSTAASDATRMWVRRYDAVARWRGTAPLLFLFAILVSLIRSWGVSFWTDESVTISVAGRTPDQIWQVLQNIDAVHGLYYVFMSAWMTAFGAGEFAMRLPSAIAIGLTAVGVLAVVRRLGSAPLALTAGVVTATLPRLTWAGIEARPFAFSAAAAVGITLLLVRALDRPHLTSWVAYGALAAFGIYINVFIALLVVAHAVSVVMLHCLRSKSTVRFAVASIAAGITSLPILLLSRTQQGQLGTAGEQGPVALAGKILVSQLFLGESPSQDASSPVFDMVWRFAAVAVAGLGLVLIACAILRPTWGPKTVRIRVLSTALPWLVLPTFVIFAYAVAVAPLYQPRYLTLTAPAGAILIAAGLHSLGRRWLVVTTATAYALCVSVVFASQRIDYAKDGSDWASAAQVIAEGAAADDAVYFTPRYAYDGPIANVTARRLAIAYPAPFRTLRDLTLRSSGAQSATLDGESIALDAVDLEGEDRVWVVYGTRYPVDVVVDDERLLRDAGFSGRQVWAGPRTVLMLYERTGTGG